MKSELVFAGVDTLCDAYVQIPGKMKLLLLFEIFAKGINMIYVDVDTASNIGGSNPPDQNI